MTSSQAQPSQPSQILFPEIPMTTRSLGSMMSTNETDDDDFMLSDALSDHTDDWTEEYTTGDEGTATEQA